MVSPHSLCNIPDLKEAVYSKTEKDMVLEESIVSVSLHSNIMGLNVIHSVKELKRYKKNATNRISAQRHEYEHTGPIFCAVI